MPSSVSPRAAAIQPLRLSFSGSNASDGGRGGSGGGGGEGEDEDDEDGQMGTMSGGRFYGPSAMSSVSSSRMNKILQDVRPPLLLRAILQTDPPFSSLPVPDDLDRNGLAFASSTLSDPSLAPLLGVQHRPDTVLWPPPALPAGFAPA